MTQPVKHYKVLLDAKTTNVDKNIVVNLGDMFQFHDYRDLIHLRAESYMDAFFQEENPTIDFEKYRFKPNTLLKGIDFYFYRQVTTTQQPVSYNQNNPPVWYINHNVFSSSSGFDIDDVPNTTGFLNSYFKFEFSLNPTIDKPLFSVILPLDGTMLESTTPIPRINFTGSTITEVQNIYWLRNPQQIPSVIFTGGTFDLFCYVSFYNAKTGKVNNFKTDSYLPNSQIVRKTHTIRDKYILYRLNYNDFTYDILHCDGTSFNNNRVKLYAI